MATLRVLLRDLTGLAGLAAVSYGAWLIYEPAGFIVAGAFAAALAVLTARRSE